MGRSWVCQADPRVFQVTPPTMQETPGVPVEHLKWLSANLCAVPVDEAVHRVI